jgi:hypothetical protein
VAFDAVTVQQWAPSTLLQFVHRGNPERALDVKSRPMRKKATRSIILRRAADQDGEPPGVPFVA